MFFKSRRERKAKDAKQQDMMVESQRLLLEAATATANIAQDVTSRLKERLDDSVKRFDATARILNDALLMCSMSGRIQASNPAAERLFGEDVAKKNVCDLFTTPSHRFVDSHSLWSAMENKPRWAHTATDPVRAIDQEGKFAWVEPSLERLDWSDGTSSMLVLIRDMRAIVNLKSAAIEAEERYSSIFDISFDGFMIVQDDIIVAANPSVSRLLGYRSSEVLSRPMAILFSEEDHATIDSTSDRVHCVVRGIHENGTVLDLVYTATTITWNGQKSKLVTVRDATDSRRLQDIVSRKHDNGIDMVVCFNTQYSITFANRPFARLAGLSRTELINRDIREFLGGQAVTSFEDGLQTLTPDHPSFRSQIQGKDGAVFDWIDHAIFDRDGGAVEYQRVGRDISEVMSSMTKK